MVSSVIQVGERFADVGLDDLADLLGPSFVEVLGREDDLGRADRLAVLVADGDLALGVGPKLAGGALALCGLGQQFEDPVGVIDRRRHQVGRFAAGIAEHDALVAGAFFALPVGGIVDALGDIGRLAMQQHVDLGVLPVEAGLLVADIVDGLAGRGLELGGIDHRETGGVLYDLAVLALLQQGIRHAHLARNHHPVGGRQRLAGDPNGRRVHPGLLGFPENQVDDSSEIRSQTLSG